MRVKSKGVVYLVGAGPGDAELLTLRGAELLRRADVVIYDQLVNPILLGLAKPGAEIISRGKRATFSQEQINSLMAEKAKEGKTVVRLKGGDPYVFGRGGEEAESLAAARIQFEVVPGVSSITAAPNYAGIPLTHREHCSSFTVLTGHENPDEAKTNLRYEEIARIPGTKVVLMGMDKLEEWTKSLIAHGMEPKTPVAVVESGTRGRQRSVAGTLATIARLVVEQKIVPPALTVIGSVVSLRPKLNWAEARPLFGQRIVVTRGLGQAAEFSRKLSELGADVLEIPAVKRMEPENKQYFIDALLSLNTYDWLVFTSASGVTTFFDYFFRRFNDMRDIGGAKIAAVGTATAAKLKDLHLQVDVMPEEFIGSKIAAAMAKHTSIENVKVCLFRAENANRELPQALEELGAIVDDIGLYKTVPETEDHFGAAEDFREHGADWITFTSGSAVEFFHQRFDLVKLVKQFPQMKLATIGPETSKTLAGLGLKPALEAKEHTTNGLLAAVLKASK
jgi:uroporphyrinogen III methyltransferase/synthase